MREGRRERGERRGRGKGEREDMLCIRRCVCMIWGCDARYICRDERSCFSRRGKEEEEEEEEEGRVALFLMRGGSIRSKYKYT